MAPCPGDLFYIGNTVMSNAAGRTVLAEEIGVVVAVNPLYLVLGTQAPFLNNSFSHRP